MTIRGTAFVGASFHIRVLATLVTKAVNLINKVEDSRPASSTRWPTPSPGSRSGASHKAASA
jgi:hypothetical protein